ncbi:MAG: hypothetical protein ABSA77_11685 [Thermoguttaceae bacterium]
MTARGSRFLIAWLVLSALFALPASGQGQSSDQTANQSTIFPSLAAKAKKEAVVWSESDVKQTSPTHKTVFEQPESAAAATGTPAPAAESSPSSLPGDECCPQCGRLARQDIRRQSGLARVSRALDQSAL